MELLARTFNSYEVLDELLYLVSFYSQLSRAHCLVIFSTGAVLPAGRLALTS
ncbi:hypothetical protein [Thermofilum sp.]|uniref:hypothetical protein n=1 Tax=Thermofilum sp. TaxID=1961369 RepID=UPI00258AFEA7|nr:hypothetical protein [Thermofilum sp.]